MMQLIQYFIIFINLTALFLMKWLISIPLIFCFFQWTNNSKPIRLANCELFVLLNTKMATFSFIVLLLVIIRIVTLIQFVIFNLVLTLLHCGLLFFTITRVIQTTCRRCKASDISNVCFLISIILVWGWLFSLLARHHRFFL